MNARLFAPPPTLPGALCAQSDPEAFYPEKGCSTREAKRVCAGCDHKSECLEWALDNNEVYGVWGGTSEKQRRQMLRDRKDAAVARIVALPAPTVRKGDRAA